MRTMIPVLAQTQHRAPGGAPACVLRWVPGRRTPPTARYGRTCWSRCGLTPRWSRQTAPARRWTKSLAQARMGGAAMGTMTVWREIMRVRMSAVELGGPRASALLGGGRVPGRPRWLRLGPGAAHGAARRTAARHRRRPARLERAARAAAVCRRPLPRASRVTWLGGTQRRGAGQRGIGPCRGRPGGPWGPPGALYRRQSGLVLGQRGSRLLARGRMRTTRAWVGWMATGKEGRS